MFETRRLPSGGGAPNEAERPDFKREESVWFSLRDDTSDKIAKLFFLVFFFKVRQKVLVRSVCCTSAAEGIRACPWIFFWVGRGGDMVF